MSQYTRNPARPVLAAELNNATETRQPGNDDRSPVFSLLPSGLDAQRVRISGTLTEAEAIRSDYYRGKIVGPTGETYVYAGDTEPEVQAFLNDVTTPAHVTAVGRIRTFKSGNDDKTYVKLSPETLSVVPAHERHRTIGEAAKGLIDRLNRLLNEADTSGRFNPEIYQEAYGEAHFEEIGYLKQAAIDALVDTDKAVGKASQNSTPDQDANAPRAD